MQRGAMAEFMGREEKQRVKLLRRGRQTGKRDFPGRAEQSAMTEKNIGSEMNQAEEEMLNK